MEQVIIYIKLFLPFPMLMYQSNFINKYQYFVSRNYDSTDLEKLKGNQKLQRSQNSWAPLTSRKVTEVLP